MLFLQISPDPVGDKAAEDKDEGGDEDAHQASSESVNRSSSFLFDSLYDSSLLAALSPNQVFDQLDEEEEIRDPLPSTQERRHSELLANQEAEQQEAVQWGESSFNLSEWGDSLLVGEHFLERQSLLKHTERTQEANQKAQKPNAEPSQIQPQPATTTTTTTQNTNKDKASNNQGETHRVKQHSNAQNDYKAGEIETKVKEINGLLSDKTVLKHQNAPDGSFYCSPGLQEIFDRWPSMSDQTWQNTTTHTATHTHAAVVPDLPQPSIQAKRKEKKPNVAAESDSREEQPSKHDGETVKERPGSAGDLIPPTQETPPVTPRVKLTTSSVQSPLIAQPLNQSTPSILLPQKPAITKCPKSRPGPTNHLSEAVADTKQPNSTSDHQPGQKPTTAPPSTKHQNPSPPRGHHASPSSPRPRLPSDAESPVTDEGFTLQLSQDASLSSSNSGAFSIIDVASDRRLFDTFINEWKTKERYSLALACEKREHRQHPEGDIGGKHKRGN